MPSGNYVSWPPGEQRDALWEMLGKDSIFCSPGLHALSSLVTWGLSPPSVPRVTISGSHEGLRGPWPLRSPTPMKLACLTFDSGCHVGFYQNKQVLLCISRSQHL